MERDFLGQGWAFPIEPDEKGQLPMAEAEESIRQSIRLILATGRGERVMRPDFGCGLHDLVFSVNNASAAGQASEAIREALILWEPRIDVLDVYAVPDRTQPNLLLLEINYQVRSTNSRYNLVYPFYLE